VNLLGFGEILPRHENRVTLDRSRKDKYGLPLLAFDAQIGENELKMRKDMASEAAAMLEAAGFKNVEEYDRPYAFGLGIHEMGAARMGRDPRSLDELAGGKWPLYVDEGTARERSLDYAAD